MRCSQSDDIRDDDYYGNRSHGDFCSYRGSARLLRDAHAMSGSYDHNSGQLYSASRHSGRNNERLVHGNFCHDVELWLRWG